MNNRTRKLSILALTAVGAIGAISASLALVANGTLTSKASTNGTWVHYAKADPGTVPETVNGIREYWVECGGAYQFTEPSGVEIEEGTAYDITEFAEDDDRWIYPITTIAEFSALTHQDDSQKTVTGYYQLMNDLNFNNGGYTEFSNSNWNWFAGTFDGNGKTITSKSRPSGLFGGLDGATLKNFTITDGWSYGGIDNNAPLISQDMKNTTLERVNCLVTAKANRTLINPLADNAQNYGWINARICMDCTFNNCAFDGIGSTVNLNVQTLVGSHPSCVRNTFTNSTFKCSQYYCVYQTSNNSGKATVVTTPDGLTITGECVYVPSV